MFTNVSMTGTGITIVLIETILRVMGIEFPDYSVTETVNGIISAGGFVFLVWGQMRRKDITWGIFRK